MSKNAAAMRMIIVCLLIISVLLSGCQPTPEREAVVAADNLEKEIASSSRSVAGYSFPENWKEKFNIEGSDATVEIDATISVPDVTAFPVYKVSKAQFDTSQAETLVSFFTKGKDVIKNNEQKTKSELEEELVLAKKQNDNEWATELEDMMNTAPETIPDEVITDWNPVQPLSGSFLDENGMDAGISVRSDYFTYMSGIIIPESMLSGMEPDDPNINREKNEIGEISISKEEAVSAAENLLQELGIDYMKAYSLEKAFCCKTFAGVYADSGEKPLSKGYLIKFARDIDGITGITYEGMHLSVYDEFAYRAPMNAEAIQIHVNEAGQPQSFIWEYPIKAKEKINENAELMPFDEMKQRIRDMLTFVNSYNSGTIKVTSIEMHMTIVDVKDHPDEGMYVPAWIIYYTKAFKGLPQDYRLVLNAIDGGRVLEAPVKIEPEIQQLMDEDRKNLLEGQ